MCVWRHYWPDMFFGYEYAAQGLMFGNSVYWIRFDEEYAEKVKADKSI